MDGKARYYGEEVMRAATEWLRACVEAEFQVLRLQ